MMNGTKLSAIAVCLALVGGSAAAKPGGSDPLDFSYRISGDQKIRPTLVFNDGVDTYVQPSLEADSDTTIKGAEFERQGPYMVIRGLASTFKVHSKKSGVATVSYLGAVAAPDAPIAPTQIVQQPTKAGSIEPQKAAVAKVEAVATEKPTRPEKESAVAQKATATAQPAEFKPRDTASEASERLASLRAEAGREVCRTTVQTKESAFVVGFGANSVSLSNAAIKSLQSAIGSTGDIQSIRGYAESANDDEKAASARAKTIFDALKKMGVDGSKISIGTRQATGVGTELRIIHGKTVDCEIPHGTVNVIASDRQNVSIAADADARDVLAKLASAAGLSFREEGSSKKINVRVIQKNRPLLLVLETIGNNLGVSADLIYRDSELVLRYRSQ